MKFLSLSCITCLVLSVQACLTPDELEGRPRKVHRRQTSNGLPIGTGDRYAGGTIAPRGGKMILLFVTIEELLISIQSVPQPIHSPQS